MKKIFKINSRLGLKFIPNGGTHHNVGVEDGADAVVNKEFIDANDVSINSFVFSKPEDVDDKEYYPTLAKESKECISQLDDFFEKDRHVVVGGDHSISFCALQSFLNNKDVSDVGLIMFDSHADLHLYDTSPSKNFHGMWLRPIMDVFDQIEINNISTKDKLKGEQVLYVGNMILESEEERFMNESNIINYTSESLSQGSHIFKNKLQEFCKKYKYIYITFDIDVFNTKLVTATGTPNEDGLNKDSIFKTFDLIKEIRNKDFSFDIVEVNPHKEPSTATVLLAQEVLNYLL